MTDDRRPSTREVAAALDRDEPPIEPIEVEVDRVDPVDRIDETDQTPLFVRADADGYRTRWSAIQTGFVDEPRRAVEEADALVAEVIKRLVDGFAEERRRLEDAWERNDSVSTEDLRQAMRRYRSFFERLLAV